VVRTDYFNTKSSEWEFQGSKIVPRPGIEPCASQFSASCHSKELQWPLYVLWFHRTGPKPRLVGSIRILFVTSIHRWSSASKVSTDHHLFFKNFKLFSTTFPSFYFQWTINNFSFLLEFNIEFTNPIKYDRQNIVLNLSNQIDF